MPLSLYCAVNYDIDVTVVLSVTVTLPVSLLPIAHACISLVLMARYLTY